MQQAHHDKVGHREAGSWLTPEQSYTKFQRNYSETPLIWLSAISFASVWNMTLLIWAHLCICAITWTVYSWIAVKWVRRYALSRSCARVAWYYQIQIIFDINPNSWTWFRKKRWSMSYQWYPSRGIGFAPHDSPLKSVGWVLFCSFIRILVVCMTGRFVN